MLCVTVEESVSTESTATRVTARNDSLENSVVRTLKGQRVCFGETFSWTVKAFWQNRNSKNSIREVKFDPPLYRSSIPLWNTFCFASGVQGFFSFFWTYSFHIFVLFVPRHWLVLLIFRARLKACFCLPSSLKPDFVMRFILCTYTYLSPFENVRSEKFLASVVAHCCLYYNSETEK